MKFEHSGLVLDSNSVEDALHAIKHFGHLPVEFMAVVETGEASEALTRLYNWAVDPDRQAKKLNLTAQPATAEQLEEGVVDLPEAAATKLQQLLTFTRIPQQNLLAARAADIAELAVQAGATHAVIGGEPYFVGHLEAALKAQGIQPLYVFPTGGFVHA